jgi:tetratricopeptide (TPR) repeat protein
MSETGLLEPSFADAIAAIEQAKELPASKRTHWCCSLRIIAKALDRPPENIAARWGAVAFKVNHLHHANSGMEWKTLANHKSNAKAALFWFRGEQGLPGRGTPLNPEWQLLRRRLKDLSRLAKLSGLIRYCSLKGIAPSAVDEAVVDTYMAYRKETTALVVDIKARRAIARAWNASRGIEGWPQQQLIEPPLKAKEAAAVGYRSIALWALGHPQAAKEDVDSALKDARANGQAATLMYTMSGALIALIHRGDVHEATDICNELVRLADEKSSTFWKGCGEILQGCVSTLIPDFSAAIRFLTSGIAAFQSTGSTYWTPTALSYLSKAYAAIGEFDNAWRSIAEAVAVIETSKETWFETEVHRIAGEIALMMQEPDRVRAEAYFERALSIARQQQAKSWELRAAMSMARLWRDQGKRNEARELLAPVYGWFTEGFDTLDLKEAKALLDALTTL